MTVPVINLAKNGRSSRSFIREGLWMELLAKSAPGDFVVLEMGHNDVRSLQTGVNRADVEGFRMEILA